MKTRAQRRHHRARIKRARQEYWGGSGRDQPQIVSTPKMCSCMMCGNPRRWLGERTLAERSHLQAFDSCVPLAQDEQDTWPPM